VGQANDVSAWSKPVRVKKRGRAVLSPTSELAARAVFFARLHREVNVETWLRRIIEERIDLEEAAFGEFKRDLAAKNGM